MTVICLRGVSPVHQNTQRITGNALAIQQPPLESATRQLRGSNTGLRGLIFIVPAAATNRREICRQGGNFQPVLFTPHGSFGAWLTRITINEALMIKRKPDNRVADNPTNIDNEELTAPNANPADTVSNKELAGLIEAAIDVLPATFRSVFVLRAVQQLSVRETAESLDIPEATVKTRFHRARCLMQENLNHSIEEIGLHAFEFAGQRCDRIVYSVLTRIGVELNEQIQVLYLIILELLKHYTHNGRAQLQLLGHTLEQEHNLTIQQLLLNILPHLSVHQAVYKFH